MTNIRIPLELTPQGLERQDDVKKSIDAMLSLIITTPQFSTPSDPDFGFILNNMRFEIFDEREGVVYDSGDTGEGVSVPGLYNKKVSGSSKNLNTFAAELRKSIMTYETRLSELSVNMTYIVEDRSIYISVVGIITETETPYRYSHVMRVWH